MASPLYYFKFNVKDWLSDPKVRAMTPAQRGAYIDLLCFQWQDGALPDNTRALARMTGIPHADFARSIWPALSGRFRVTEADRGSIKNKRLDEERGKAQGKVSTLAENGAKGAETLAANRANAGLDSGQMPENEAGKRPANGRDSRESIVDRVEDPPVSPASGGNFKLAPAAPHAPKPTRAERQRTAAQEHRETATAALDVFNAERERLRLGGPLRATDGNLVEIVKRLRDGATIDECEHVIRAAAYEVEQGGEPKWFNPATLFRASTWPVRLAAYAPPKPTKRDPEAEARAEEIEAERARRRVEELTA